ncbi:hypothetical protein Ahy_B09g098464 isoform C [Arachis hypogaea]|uniref:Uncharacterized protein n=1 Tax=Arachis hypogaea TaxID=3818 RepID=A0A444XRA5_ARAHY|nr:hypothetical protein Ahy_B09g098464 isoform C [Arachis hypogaea]
MERWPKLLCNGAVWLGRMVRFCSCLFGIELDALELDMGNETEADGVPSYLQPDKETDLEAELNLPPAPTGQTTVPAGRSNPQNEDELGLPAVPRASLRGIFTLKLYTNKSRFIWVYK